MRRYVKKMKMKHNRGLRPMASQEFSIEIPDKEADQIHSGTLLGLCLDG